MADLIPVDGLPPTLHLRPTAAPADRALLPGDPGRAMMLAQLLLTEPRMFNHHRGLWGYAGAAADGRRMLVQSTGMGGPSAAIVVSELVELGVRRLIRVGTCGALSSTASLGEIVLVADCLPSDGASRALDGDAAKRPAPGVLAALQAAAGGTARFVRAVSSDLFYDERPEREEAWIAAGAEVVEMEAATVLALAARRGVEAGAVLIVTDLLRPERRRIGGDELLAAEQRAGRIAAAALTALPPSAGASGVGVRRGQI